ncbi:type 1 glutamine amidotransferase [Phormidesmis sp. 146-33]
MTAILVIRHEKCTSLGMLKNAAQENNFSIQYLDISQGEGLSHPLESYSHIVVLGGSISAYQNDEYPFLRDEFKLLESAIAQKIPTLGICLGSQVLAKVLGGSVYRGKAGREAGWCEVQLTEAAKTDPLLREFPDRFKVFQSHQDTFDLPPSCTHLAKSEIYTHQAFRYQDFLWAIQFHLEMDDAVIQDCSIVLEQEFAESQIDESVDRMLIEAKQFSPLVAPLAHQFMHNFLQVS